MYRSLPHTHIYAHLNCINDSLLIHWLLSSGMMRSRWQFSNILMCSLLWCLVHFKSETKVSGAMAPPLWSQLILIVPYLRYELKFYIKLLISVLSRIVNQSMRIKLLGVTGLRRRQGNPVLGWNNAWIWVPE